MPTADFALRLPPLPPRRVDVLIVRLAGDRATHFGSIAGLRGAAGETVRSNVELRPAVRIEGRLGDNVPRPVTGGYVVAEMLSSPHVDLFWSNWAPIEPDGSFALDAWPADIPLQLIALCDGYIACSGDPPPDIFDRHAAPAAINDARLAQTALAQLLYRAADAAPLSTLARHLQRAATAVQPPKRDRRLRPQLFEPATFSHTIELRMTPRVRCQFEAADTQGRALADVQVYAGPNCAWWTGGSGIYAAGGARSEQYLLDPEGATDVARRRQAPFFAVTDAQGHCAIDLPVGSWSVGVKHPEYELPVVVGCSVSRVDDTFVLPGWTYPVGLVLQPSGIDQMGAYEREPDRKFRQQLAQLRGVWAASHEQLEPALLGHLFGKLAMAYEAQGNVEEAALWRRRAAEQAPAEFGVIPQ